MNIEFFIPPLKLVNFCCRRFSHLLERRARHPDCVYQSEAAVNHDRNRECPFYHNRISFLKCGDYPPGQVDTLSTMIKLNLSRLRSKHFFFSPLHPLFFSTIEIFSAYPNISTYSEQSPLASNTLNLPKHFQPFVNNFNYTNTFHLLQHS